jgi:hypothetical protein
LLRSSRENQRVTPFLRHPRSYRRPAFSDTVITPKESKSEAGTLTLTAVTAHEIKATVAIDNKAPRNFALHVDQAGALSTTSQNAPSTAEQALLLLWKRTVPSEPRSSPPRRSVASKSWNGWQKKRVESPTQLRKPDDRSNLRGD